ncbi:MAG: radical SAM protein [Ignisphaera sp.]|nr:radical SAM protein [Ignisphaera sp.]
MAKEERGGVSAFLAATRIFLGNPFTRAFLRLGVKEVYCRSHTNYSYSRRSLIYYALLNLTGTPLQCPLTARFFIDFTKMLIEVGVKILGGRIDDVKEALKIPGIRKGIETVLKGIAYYGVTVPQKLPAPFMIVWDFTNMCNLRCKHCYRAAGKPLPNELTLEYRLRLVAELDKAGVAAVALSGGEPTIHPDYLTIVKALARREFYVATATNGWRFADFDELKKAVDAGLNYVEVSVDSANPRKHDEFRGVEGSWQRAVKALENAVKLGLSHAMAVTITKYNIDEVDDILDLAESIGVKRVVFFNFVPTGRGKEIVDLDLDPFEREELMRRLYREMKRRKIEIFTTAPQYGRVVIQMSGGKEAAPTHFAVRGDPVVTAIAEYVGGCGAGRIYAAILPEGTVTPCVFLPIPVGNVREKPFWEIWEKSPLLNMLRDRDNLKGFCRVCPYRNVCGGCRARAFGYFGDPLAPDPGCIYNYRYWKELKEKIVAAKVSPLTSS